MKLNRARVVGGFAFKALLSGVSTIGLLAAAPALAQSADGETEEGEGAGEENQIIVTGLRASLESSAAQKRSADTVVDVVTASDIGALPDRSVSEVLQRLPGVSVLRFSGPNDPDHFAVEGSGVVIRGLPFVRSELNGRDVFAANSAGVLGFQDVSPELLGSVVVYKNATADLIEGGAAGTIDLRTRLPFDQAGQVIAGSVEANYGDFREEWSPSGSFLYSNNWDLSDGSRIGLLGSVAYSELLSRADGSGITNYVAASDGALIPNGGSIRTQEFDRERFGISAAAQYESGDGRWLATAQFLRSESDLTWGEFALETNADSAGAPDGFDRSDFTFDDDGVFTSGTIVDNSQWRGPNVSGRLASEGGLQLFPDRSRDEEHITEDYGFNLKFEATDNLRFNFDAQYITSTTDIADVTVHRGLFAPIFLDASGDGVPLVQVQVPNGEPTDFFQDPGNYYIRSAMDHITENEADSFAFRGDVEYDFSGDGWLKSIRAGARFSQQESTLRESDFNWGNVSEVWTGATFNDGSPLLFAGNNPDASLDALVDPLFGTATFDNFQRGVDAGFGGSIPAYTGPGADNYQGFADAFNSIIDTLYGVGNFSPSGWRPLGSRPGVIEGTPFLPSEIGMIERDNFSAYVRADFETDASADVVLSGNIGLRYVHTDRSVDSSFTAGSFQSLLPGAPLCDITTPGFNPPDFCSLDLDALEAALGDGFAVQREVNRSYDEFLPSLNLKLDIPGNHVLRVALSKTLTRPGVDQLNERIDLNTQTGDPIPDGSGGTINPFVGFVGSSTGNASLDPQKSYNIDISWEWYFNRTGSLTIAGFHKEIEDFIAFAPVAVDIPTDGVPAAFIANENLNPLLRNTQVNSDENGSVTGFEVAYQQFYDFLPGVLSGLGTQFTYTYIDSEGVDNQLDPDVPSDDPPTARFAVDAGVFPRISRHNINAVALYEKGPVQARLAYNWRSSFQLTPRDVIFPFASVYQPATGQLDASIFVDVTDNIKVGVQGVNLTNDITVTEQSINEAGLRAPRNFFQNDRRYTFILRANF